MLCFVILLGDQGSRDNMSIVIVAFEGAPTVSEEALQKEKELDKRLEVKVKGVVFTIVNLLPFCVNFLMENNK